MATKKTNLQKKDQTEITDWYGLRGQMYIEKKKQETEKNDQTDNKELGQISWRNFLKDKIQMNYSQKLNPEEIKELFEAIQDKLVPYNSVKIQSLLSQSLIIPDGEAVQLETLLHHHVIGKDTENIFQKNQSLLQKQKIQKECEILLQNKEIDTKKDQLVEIQQVGEDKTEIKEYPQIDQFLSNLIDKMPETKILHQNRQALKTQLVELLTSQYKCGSLDFQSLKKCIKSNEIQIFQQEVTNNFQRYQQQQVPKANYLQNDKRTIQQSKEETKFPQSIIFFKECFRNQEIEQKYLQSMLPDQNNDMTKIPVILQREKERFFKQLESKYKEENLAMQTAYSDFKIKNNHPFHLLLERSILKAELIKILKENSYILREESGIYEIPKILNKLEGIKSVENAKNSEEKLENLHSTYQINEDVLDIDDFKELIGNLFLKQNFMEWLESQKFILKQINLKLQEEINQLTYIEQQIKDSTFLKIAQRLLGKDPNKIPKNFMQCMYTLGPDYIKNELKAFDNGNTQPINYQEEGIINILMPYIQTSLKQVKNFEEIFLLFCDNQDRPEYELNQKNFMTFVLEKFQQKPLLNQNIINCYNKFSQPFSLVYKYVDQQSNQIKSTLSFTFFRHFLQNNSTFLISIGGGECGASTTLNHVYSTNFSTNKHNILENDIDIFFDSPSLTIGLNIIDVHGDCILKKDQLTIILKFIKYYQHWILVQAKTLEKLLEIKNNLRSLDVKLNQVIFLLKDKAFCEDDVQKNKQLFDDGTYIQISQIHSDKSQGIYARDLARLKKELKNLIGFGKNVKKKETNQQKSIQNYWDMQNEMAKIQKEYSQITIKLDFKLEKVSQIMMSIIKGIYYEKQYLQEQQISALRKFMNLPEKLSRNYQTRKYQQIYKGKENIKNQIFVNLTIMDECTELQIRKNKLGLKQGFETKIEINNIIAEMNDYKQLQSELGVHPIVEFYIDAFCSKKEEELNEFEVLIDIVAQPILKPIEIRVQKISRDLKICQYRLNNCEKKYYDEVQTKKEINADQVEDWVKRQAAKDVEWKEIYKNYQELKNQLIFEQKLIENSMMSRDLFQREMIYITQSLKQKNKNDPKHKDVINIFKNKFLEGKSIEIIDGNNNSINYVILKDIFDEVTQYMNQQNNNNFEFLSVAILGPQSTGKSTLINMIFGCEFKVSSGRCTKGMDISLRKVHYNNKDYFILVMDTEGLLSIEKADESYDKRLTLLSMACANKVIVNVHGEINIAMKKILSVSLFAGNKLKELNHRPELIFCLRNMADIEQIKMSEALIAIEKELKEVAKINKVQLQQCLDFKGEDSLVLMRSAFNIETTYLEQDDDTVLYEKMATDKQFMQAIEVLKQKIFKGDINYKKSLNDWLNGCSSCWEAIQQNFDIFMIDSIKEIEDRNCLGQIIKQIKDSSSYLTISQTLSDIRSKNEKKLNQQNNDQRIIKDNCRYELQKSYEESVETVHYEYKRLTDGYQNQDLIQEYKKSLTQDIFLMYLKQEQLWGETIVSNDNECNIKKKLQQLKKKLQDYLCSFKHVDDQNEIKKREDKLNEIFKEEINILEMELKAELQKKEPEIQQIFEIVAQSFYSYSKSIKVEEQPYSMTQVKHISELLDVKNKNLQQLYILAQNLFEASLKQYFQEQYLKDDQIKSGIDFSKQLAQNSNINLNKSSYNQQNQKNAAILDKQKQELQQKKQRGFFNSIKNFFNSSKENIKDIKNQDSDSERKFIKTNQNYEKIIQLKGCISTYLIDLTQELCLEKETQEGVIRKLHFMLETASEDLQQENLDFTQKFKIDILVEFLFYTFIFYQFKRIKNHQEENLKYFEDSAKDLKDKILFMIKEGINEQKNLTQLIECINNNIAKTISVKFKSNVETNLRQESLNISPVDLNDICYQIFGSDACTKQETQLFIDNFYEFRRQKNKDILKEYKDNIVKQQKNSIKKEINYQHTIFVQKLVFMHNIYSQLDFNQLDEDKSKACNKYLAENFNAVLTGNQNRYKESLNKIIQQFNQNQNSSIFLEIEQQYQNSQIFNQACKSQDPTLIEINQPKDFIEKLIILFTENTNKDFKIEPHEIIQALNKVNTKKVISLYKQSQQYKEIIDFTENKFQEYLIIDKCCPETCPFCSQPCQQEKGHSGKHNLKFHSLMAFKGVFEIDQKQEKSFVFDYCNSETNISKFFRKTKIDTRQLTERISQYSLSTNNLFFCLTWYNIQDLDLYVKCPCGTVIYYYNKECPICLTYLEIDMNISEPYSENPVEHVYLKKLPEPNLKFEFWVQWAQSKREGPDTCEFLLQVVQEGGSSIKEYKNILERNKTKSDVYTYFTQQYGIQFQEYMHQNHSDWTIVKSEQQYQSEWVLRQQKAWSQIGDDVSKKYSLQNNPPFKI